jgi:isopentenyl-diphosphate delta-isomerase
MERDVGAKGISNGFDAFRLVNCALPEVDLAEIDTTTKFFNRKLQAPILISCMTGGSPESAQINQILAQVAQERKLAMGLGSGRALLEHPELKETFDVRDIAPDVLLFANLGAVQLNRGYGVDDCRRLVEMLAADALVLHLNALQEALQPEGDTFFGGLLRQIEHICSRLEVPIVVKEVGWGIDPEVVRRLLDAGVAAIDIAGAGGTSWSEVERHRITEPWRARVAAQFSGWGISTAEALRAARNGYPLATIIGSGGIHTGMDVVKAIALGADLVGIAGPFLRAAGAGYEAAAELAAELCQVLRVAMFALGERNIQNLRVTERILHRDERLR